MRAGHARVRLHDRHCRACAAARSVLPAARRASGAAVLASSGSFQAHGTSSLCGAALAAQRRRRRPRSTRREKPHRIALLPPVGSALHAPAASSADTSAVWPGLSQALGYAGGCGARRRTHAVRTRETVPGASHGGAHTPAPPLGAPIRPRTMTRRCRSEDADAVPSSLRVRVSSLGSCKGT